MVKHWFHSYLLNHYSDNVNLALDDGCGEKPYHDDYSCKYIGIDTRTTDYHQLKPDIFAEGSRLPFQDNSFDLLVSYAVIPYVKNIDTYLNEMYRVLRPGSTALIIIMNPRGLDLHKNTFFENRFNSRQLNQKLKKCGFKSRMKNNIKALFWSTYYDMTSVYCYAIITPNK